MKLCKSGGNTFLFCIHLSILVIRVNNFHMGLKFLGIVQVQPFYLG